MSTTYFNLPHRSWFFILRSFLVLILFLGASAVHGQLPFITTWQTTTADESITIPTTGTGYSYTVDWGDSGTDETVYTGNATHNYATAGTYTVSISGDFPRIYFNNGYQGQHKGKILTIEQWGDQVWSSMGAAFDGCANLRVPASDAPDLSSVSAAWNMFRFCSSFNEPINHWDVSNVTNMTDMFQGTSIFNQPLNSWDVSNVTNMGDMFFYAFDFNGDISNWDVGNVTDMNNMFYGTRSFDQSLENWDVSNVKHMDGMFADTNSFNGDISNWDVGNVTDMDRMFFYATNFNVDISGWNVGEVSDMSLMFYNAAKFNIDIGDWGVSKVIDMNKMFYNAKVFNQDLTDWQVDVVSDMSGMFYGTDDFNGDISTWDVSSVTNMNNMFYEAITFNQDLSSWDVSKVATMIEMFYGANDFNGDISTWDVSSVTNMNSMFYNAKVFNQDLSNWNVSSVTTMTSLFHGASTFNQNLSIWEVGNVTSMNSMFYNATVFNQDLSSWDVSSVADMVAMFRGASSFDSPLMNWKTSSVTNMNSMFYGATIFSQDLSSWDVSNVTTMTGIFLSASNFNGDISTWNVSNVVNMSQLFKDANSFNQDISDWEVRGVTDMNYMFSGASVFDQDLSSWDVSSVQYMYGMFEKTNVFDQDLSNWDVGSVLNMGSILDYSGMSIINFDAILQQWPLLPELQHNINIGVEGVAYCKGSAGRETLINDFGWSFNDNEISCFEVSDSFFIVEENLDSATVIGVLDFNSVYGQVAYVTSPYSDELFIDPLTRELIVIDNSILDYESRTTLNFGINIFDEVDDYANFSVKINISDINDAPIISDQVLSIQENSSFTDLVGLIIASDQDVDDTFSYSIISGNEENAFTLNGSTGELFVNDESLFDFETRKDFEMTVQVTDNSGGSNQATITVEILNEVEVAFLTTWKTDNEGISDDVSITVPTTGNGYEYIVDWGDGNTDETIYTGSATHEYEVAGTYTVSISGHFPRIYFANTGDKDKILTVEQWGDIIWTDMRSAFYGCTNLTIPTTDAPNLESVSYTNSMFNGCSSFNQPINHWDVGNVTNMAAMFVDAVAFNQPLDAWDVSNVTSMVNMFKGAISFNQPLNSWDIQNVSDLDGMFNGAIHFDSDISNWDVSNVIDMSWMFYEASSFNQDLTSWNVSNVNNLALMFSGASTFNKDLSSWNVSSATSLYGMFRDALAFNQDISSWDVSNVTDMYAVFEGATVFNQELNNWDVSNVTRVSSMLDGAISFNQPLNNWDLSNVTQMTGMLDNCGISVSNYDETLTAWSQLEGLQNDLTLGSEQMYYCQSVEARQTLIDNFGWTIEGDEPSCINVESPSFKVDENLEVGQTVGIMEFSSLGDFEITAALLSLDNYFSIDLESGILTVLDNSILDFEENVIIEMEVFYELDDGTSEERFITILLTDLNESPLIEDQVFRTAEDEISITIIAYDQDSEDVISYEILEGNVDDAFKLDPSTGHLTVNNFDAIDTGENSSFELQVRAMDNEGLSDESTVRIDIYAEADAAFITTWQTTTDGERITIPTIGSGYSYTVDWGDDSIDETIYIDDATHEYSTVGIYTVSILGDFSGIYFYNSEDKNKIISIEQWGIISWRYLERAFYDCSELTYNATDSPDLFLVTSLDEMFYGASQFDGEIGNWDVSSVTDMHGMFERASSFNSSLNTWDVSSVTDMWSMFEQASSFNQPLDGWDVSNVTGRFGMSSMFQSATSFNQPLSSWDVSNVQRIDGMFSGAASFNQDLSAWDVSSVKLMYSMFWGATSFDQPLNTWDMSSAINIYGMFYAARSFNQPLDSWDVSNVTSIYSIFSEATSFDQDLSTWDVSNATDLSSMLDNSGISVSNYDNTLIAWSQLETLPSDIILGVEDVNYCFSEDAREVLINDFGWTLEGDFRNCLRGSTLPNALARTGSVSFTIGEEAYFGLGRDDDSYYQDFYKVNPITSELTQIADYPGIARSEAVAFVSQNKAYIGTGWDEDFNKLNDFYSYDPETNQWTQISSITGVRTSAVAFTLLDEGYVGTGNGADGDLSDFWKYDVESNSWSEISGFTGESRREAVAFVLHDKAYVSGGFKFDGFSSQLSDVQEYDPTTNLWSEKVFADTDLSFTDATAFTLKNKAFIAYGNQGQITEYDPVTNEISNLDDVLGIDTGATGSVLADAVSFVLQDTAYITLGSSGFFTTIYHPELLEFFIDNYSPTNIYLSSSTLAEKNLENALIGELSTYDFNNTGTHIYELIEGDGTNDQDNQYFSITEDQLYTNIIFDFEEKQEYFIYVRTTDKYGEFFDKEFTITVSDINEIPVIEDQTFTVSENSASNSQIGTVEVFDPEGSDIISSIVLGNESDWFQLSDNLLIIKDSSAFDFETNPTIVLEIESSDGALTNQATITIMVSDIDEMPALKNQIFTVSENSGSNSQIGTVEVFDPEGSDIITSIISGNENDWFELSDNLLLIKDSSAFDFETNPSMVLEITSSDGALTSQAIITITVADVNESPVFEDNTFNISSKTESGVLVGFLEVSDPDGDLLTYTIVSGNADDAFSIDVEGNLVVASNAAIRKGSNPVFELLINAGDGSLSTDAKVVVEVETILNSKEALTKINIYPNPVTNNLIIDSGDLNISQTEIQVINLVGHELMNIQGQNQIDVSSLKSGTYILRLVFENKTEESRFVKY